MTYGFIAGSFKPTQIGHWKLIVRAAGEVDRLELYISLGDRMRPGEVPILGSDMEWLWKTCLEPALPSNVDVHYVVAPVRAVFERLGEENEKGNWTDEFVIFSDPEDLDSTFSEASMEKYLDRLWERGQISRRRVPRSSTTDISGTEMRKFIELGDQTNFIRNLPPPCQSRGEEIFKRFQTSYQTLGRVPEKKTRKKLSEVLGFYVG